MPSLRRRTRTTGADVSVAAPESATAPVAPPSFQPVAILTRRYGRLHRAVRNLDTGVILSAEQNNLDERTYDIVAEGAGAVDAAPHTVNYRKLCTRCFPQ